MNLTFTDAAKKLSWKEFRQQHFNLTVFEAMPEDEREKFLQEKWEFISGKKVNKVSKLEGE